MFNSFKRFLGLGDEYRGVVDEADVNFCWTGHHGMSPFPSSLAFDQIQRLLAVGTHVGGILKIFGKVGLEHTIVSKTKSRMQFVRFLIDGRLVIAFDYVVEIWSINEPRLLALHEWKHSRITAVIMHPGTSYIYLGFYDGTVEIMNVDSGAVSVYKIKAQDVGLESDNSKGLVENDFSVNSMAINPVNEGLLLIAYANGFIVEWDLKTRSTVKARHSKQPLRAVWWAPNGKRFVSGHINGEIIIWKHKKSSHESRFFLAKTDQTLRPVKKIVWTTINSQEKLLILGGTPSDEPIAFVVATKGKDRDHPIEETISMEFGSHDSDIIDYILVAPSPWLPLFLEPSSIIVATSEGKLYANEFASSGEIVPMKIPALFAIQHDKIALAKSFRVSYDFIRDMRKVSNLPYSREKWGCTGGVIKGSTGEEEEPIPKDPKILITAYLNTTLTLWDTTFKRFVPLITINFNDLWEKDKQQPKSSLSSVITAVELCAESRTLTIGNSRGELFVFSFTLKDKPNHQVITSMDPDKNKVLSMGNTKASPDASPRSSLRLSSSQNLPQSPQSPQSPPSPSMKRDSREVNANYPTPPPSPTTSNSGIPRNASGGNLSASTTILAKVFKKDFGAGFVPSMYAYLPDTCITSVALETGLERIALGDTNGILRLFDTSNNNMVFMFSKSLISLGVVSQSITRMSFCQSIIDGKNVLLLVAGLESDGIVTVNLATSVLMQPVLYKQPTPLKYFAVINERGKVLKIRPKTWNEESASTNNNNANTNTAAPVAMQSSGGPETAPKGQPKPKYLIVGRDKHITLYMLPNFEKVSKAELKMDNHYEWVDHFAVKDVDGNDECGIIAFDKNYNLLVYRLLSLEFVNNTKQYNIMTFFGDQRPSKEPLIVSQDDGSMFIFSNASEVIRTSVFPKITDAKNYQAVFQRSDLKVPEKPKVSQSLLKSLFVGGPPVLNFEEMYGATTPVKPVLSNSANNTNARQIGNSQSDRDQLMAGATKPVATHSDQNLKNSRTQSTQKQIGDVHNVMNQNLQALSERGEKLQQLSDKTQDMENASANFLSNVKELVASQQKKE
jgi:hypothetical protein